MHLEDSLYCPLKRDAMYPFKPIFKANFIFSYGRSLEEFPKQTLCSLMEKVQREFPFNYILETKIKSPVSPST